MMEFLKLHITFILELIKLDFTENFPKKKENFEISSNISLCLARFGSVAVDMSSFRPSLCPVFGRRYVQNWTEKFAIRRVITD